MNAIKISFLMLALMAIFVMVGYSFGGQGGMIIALVLAVAMNFFTYWFSDKVVLKMYRAREIQENDHPRLYRTVRRVVQAAQAPMPKVCIIPGRAPNAFATGRNPDNAAVAVTEGMLEMLTEDELEGVIGHEMAHILNRDMLIGTIAATFAGAIGVLASIARWGAIFGGFSRGDDRDGGIVGILVAAFVAPLMAMVLQMAISRQREYKADFTGGRITGKPLALASALAKLQRAPTRTLFSRNRATANLMIVNPLSGKGIMSWFSTHPPIEKRIERLKKQAKEEPYQSYAG